MREDGGIKSFDTRINKFERELGDSNELGDSESKFETDQDVGDEV